MAKNALSIGRAQTELERLAADAARILRSMPASGVIVVDRALHVVLMEGAIFQRHGYDPATVQDRHIRDVIPAAAWHTISEPWHDALDGQRGTLEFASTDGLAVYSLHFAPLVGRDERPAGAMMVAKDITERVHAAESLERRLAQQSAVSSLGSLALREPALDALLEEAAKVLELNLSADLAAVFEHTGDGKASIRAAAGTSAAVAPPSTSESRQSFELIRGSTGPLLSADIRTETRFAAPVLAAQGMVSLVAAPIGVGADAFGFLGACSRREAAFSEEDLAFIQSVANVLSASTDREQALARATEAESRIANLWELSLDPLAIFSPDGTFLEVNHAWERVLGWTAEDLVGKSATDFIHRDDLDETMVNADPRTQPDGEVPEIVNRFTAKDGSSRWLLWSVRQADDGYLYSVAKDITERIRERELANEREDQLNQAQRIAHMGSWQTDLVSRQFTASESLQSMLALSAETVSFEEVFARIHPDDRGLVEAKFAATRIDTEPTEFRAVLPDGSERVFCSYVEPTIEDGRVVLLHGMIQDLTDARTAELERRRSDERFRQGFDNSPIAMALVKPGSMQFVRVNDSLCRFLGRATEDLLKLSVREVTHPDQAGAERQGMQDLASGAAMDYSCEKRYLRPDGSIRWGALSVTTALDADGSVDVMVAQIVDITDRKLREEVVDLELGEVAWLGEIRAAFEDDRFELHAQPISDIANGDVVQHELLIRMRDRDGGLIAPGMFLPAAEKYGAIKEIDRWVISRGAEIAARGIDVAINLSGVSLGDGSLFAHIEGALEASGADPSRLTFEITETALMKSGEIAASLIQQTRGLGCRFALDDFGTGFGAFQHLKSLPLDFLKIDQEFVRDAVTSEQDRHVIWAVVSLAKRFGLQTVAEGVEDQGTLDLLAQMDVDQAQGYHLGRPAPLAHAPNPAA